MGNKTGFCWCTVVLQRWSGNTFCSPDVRKHICFRRAREMSCFSFQLIKWSYHNICQDKKILTYLLTLNVKSVNCRVLLVQQSKTHWSVIYCHLCWREAAEPQIWESGTSKCFVTFLEKCLDRLLDYQNKTILKSLRMKLHVILNVPFRSKPLKTCSPEAKWK